MFDTISGLHKNNDCIQVFGYNYYFQKKNNSFYESMYTLKISKRKLRSMVVKTRIFLNNFINLINLKGLLSLRYKASSKDTKYYIVLLYTVTNCSVLLYWMECTKLNQGPVWQFPQFMGEMYCLEHIACLPTATTVLLCKITLYVGKLVHLSCNKSMGAWFRFICWCFKPCRQMVFKYRSSRSLQAYNISDIICM